MRPPILPQDGGPLRYAIPMSNQIHQPPHGVSGAGLSFDYVQWTPGTVAQLSNVPWDAMYRDVACFGNGEDVPSDMAMLDAYLASKSGPQFTFDKMTYAKPGHPVRIPLPFNAAMNFNYLRVSNPMQPIGGDVLKSYYYFINNVRYLAPNTTELDIQLDVWTTFVNQVQVYNAFVERGHVGIAQQNGFDKYGREFLIAPEGLDVGSEYAVTDARAQMLCGATTMSVVGNQKFMDKYMVIVTATTNLRLDPGTVAAPNMDASSGSSAEGVPNGTDIYALTADEFAAFAVKLSNYPWVAQGIVSITAVPPFPLTNAPQVQLLHSPECTAIQFDGVRIPHQERQVFDNFRDGFVIPERFRHLKKFLTYPYALVEMTTYSGTPIILKPECINHPHATVVQMTHAVPPGPRVSFYPYRYNALQDHTVYRVNTREYGASEIWSDYGAEFLDMQFGIMNLPQFSIANSGYLQYMAANANSIAYGYNSADWSQQRALTGNQLGFDQATAGMQLSQNLNSLGIGAMNASTDLSNQMAVGRGIASIGTSMAGGAMGGGLAGAALGAMGTVANTALTVHQQTAQNSINTGLSRAQNDASVGNMGYMRDSNKQFADWAARGDYANTIAGLNAKVQDAKMIQPTTAGQVGGDAFNLATIGWGVHVKLKQIHPGVMRQIGDYWLRYGYAINRWMVVPDNFHVMTKFTYWKLKEVYLTRSNIPEYYKGVIRGIFEKGVTVWRDPEEIGRVDISENEPILGWYL